MSTAGEGPLDKLLGAGKMTFSKRPESRWRSVAVAGGLSLLCASGCQGAATPQGPEDEGTRVTETVAAGAETRHETLEARGQGAEQHDVEQLDVEQLGVKIVAVYPHDPTAFTQGLVWDGGMLYESTGLYGRSTLRRVEPTSGTVLDNRHLDHGFFGEGLTLVGDHLVQLTWKAGVAFVYEVGSMEIVDEWGYNGEGWGLATTPDGRLLMSDGSSRLTARDPKDFRWLSTIEVTRGGEPVDHLNELEMVDGRLYANVWGRDRIVRLDPETGQVDAEIDASGLLTPAEQRMVDVLNGIAYDPMSETFWITGKFWPKMFQVKFVPKSGAS